MTWHSCKQADISVEPNDELGKVAHARGVAERITCATGLDYLILVPTLRCNLSCSYCQVSRVSELRSGFDWNDDTLRAVLELIDGLKTPTLKVEFQGGEPTLRPDIIRTVIERCERFEKAEFVICTNLQRLDDEILRYSTNSMSSLALLSMVTRQPTATTARTMTPPPSSF